MSLHICDKISEVDNNESYKKEITFEKSNRFYLNSLLAVYYKTNFNCSNITIQNIKTVRDIHDIQNRYDKVDTLTKKNGQRDFILKNQRHVTSIVYALRKWLKKTCGINIGRIKENCYLDFSDTMRFDIVIESLKLIIEVDLYSSHCNRNDNNKDQIVKENGYTLIRVRQKNIQSTNFANVVTFNQHAWESSCSLQLIELLLLIAQERLQIKFKTSVKIIKYKFYEDFFKKDIEFKDLFLTDDERMLYYEKNLIDQMASKERDVFCTWKSA